MNHNGAAKGISDESDRVETALVAIRAIPQFIIASSNRPLRWNLDTFAWSPPPAGLLVERA